MDIAGLFGWHQRACRRCGGHGKQYKVIQPSTPYPSCGTYAIYAKVTDLPCLQCHGKGSEWVRGDEEPEYL